MLAWLEFWMGLSEPEKTKYLEQHKPDEDWAWWLSQLIANSEIIDNFRAKRV
jgi:hypothetical protein